MTEVGKFIRWKRLVNSETGKILMVPMDQGGLFGPLEGLIDPKDTIKKVIEGGADAILINRGVARYACSEFAGKVGFVLRLSGCTAASPYFPFETVIASVKHAVRLGADAVAFTVNIGEKNEAAALKMFGALTDECADLNIPVIGEFLPYGEKIDDPYGAKYVKQAARVGAELGADIIKTNYTGSVESFREVTEGCPVPVVIAGGSKKGSVRAVLEMIKGAMEGGAIGICTGRNLWQYEDTVAMTQAAYEIVHQGADVERGLSIVKSRDTRA